MNEKRLIDKLVTYTVEHEGSVFIIENVPARVNEETGEQFFSPSTVEELQLVIRSNRKPDRMIETPVYYFREKAA